MTRAYIALDDGAIINIACDSMDRDGDHIWFFHDGNIVAIIRLDKLVDAHLTPKGATT